MRFLVTPRAGVQTLKIVLLWKRVARYDRKLGGGSVFSAKMYRALPLLHQKLHMCLKENCMKKELYVGNLSYDITEDDLRRVFTVAGTVTSVHIITDTVTGASKGCAYVRMAGQDDIREAVESLDGALLGDRLMSVSIARPQKPKERPVAGQRGKPGGGGRFGKDRK